MADIRQTTAYLDDFQRAASDPASGNWGDTIFFGHMAIAGATLVDRRLTHGTMQSPAIGYWTANSYAGDDQELWGCPEGGGEINGIAWAMGLFKDFGGSIDGYRFRWESVGAVWTLRRYVNGAFTVLTTSSSPNPPIVGAYMLMRRIGDDIEGWVSGLGLDASTWTRVIRATSTTFKDDLLHPCLGVTDNAQTKQLGWGCFGAGPEEEVHRTQIYRVLHGNAPHVPE